MTQELSIKLARHYYEILRHRVAVANLLHTRFDMFNIELTCNGMDCINFDGELFDVNYGNICATITCHNDVIKLVDNVEIWTNENILYSNYKFGED